MDFFYRFFMQCGIPHDPSLAHLFPRELELRLDQANQIPFLLQYPDCCWQDLCKGNKGKIHYHQINLFPEVGFNQVSTIELLLHYHPWILSQFPCQLIRPDIHRVYPLCTMLQETICEATGRSPKIQADPACGNNPETLQRSFHLEPPPPDIPGPLQNGKRGI